MKMKVIIVSLAAFAALSIPAHAADSSDYGYREYTWGMGTDGLRARPHCGLECQRKRAAYWKQRAQAKDATRVYAYQRREDDREDKRPHCLDTRVKIISTEHTTQANATEAGRKMWMAAAQWEWGSKYMDLENAADSRVHCGPSNAMDTTAGKISEALSVGRDGQFNVRCVIDARPCRARLERMDRER